MTRPRHFQTSPSQDGSVLRRALFWIAVLLASGGAVNLLVAARRAAAGALFFE